YVQQYTVNPIRIQTDSDLELKDWNPDLSRSSCPRYMAIADVFEMDLRSGHLVVGVRLPPQR
ncbi:PLP-dependent aminotransferase family protein, partial [Rhizobium brockwellii]